tara:strand:- start:651 stop:851 length:201 start_codon:yes stop_codon:yes gene_type:complete
MKNIIKIHKKELNNSITEIRIEEIRDVDFQFKPYWYIYCILENGRRIEVGRTKFKPKCYKQVSIYK